MDYGISTWIFPTLTVEEALGLLGRQGITLVELAFRNLAMSSVDADLKMNYQRGMGAWRLTLDSIPTDNIAEAANSLGIQPIQMHAPNFDLADFDDSRRRLAVRKTEVAVEMCSRLGIPRLVIHVGMDQTEMSRYTDYVKKVRRINFESIGKLSRAAANLGVQLAIENRGQNIYGSRAGDLLEIVNNTDPDAVSICIDTGHSNEIGLAPSDMVRKVGANLGATHVHDNDGTSDQHLPPFSGGIDWPDFALALKEIRYPGPLIAEIQGSGYLRIGENRLILTRLSMDRLVDL